MKEINLPKSWEEVSYDQYEQLIELEEDTDLDYIDKKLIQLCILHNVEDGYFDEYPHKKTEELLKQISFLNHPVKGEIKEFIEIGGKKLYFKDFKTNCLTGEFIDLENNIKQKDFIKFLLIIYRKKELVDPDYKIYEFEKYNTNILKRKKYVDNSKISAALILNLIEEFNSFSKELYDSYSESFESDVATDPKDTENLSLKEKKELEAAEKEFENRKKWSWESILYYLADGDIVKMLDLLDLPIIYVLNMLSFKQENSNQE